MVEPFALGSGPDACLLLHGLTGSPAEVRPVAELLAQSGFRCVGPLLPGHGTKAEDLITVTRSELVEAAQKALLSLAGARRVFLCGLSAGALLTVHVASKSWVGHGLPDISAIALLAPAVEFTASTWLFTRLPALPVLIGKGNERADGAYNQIPLRWGAELRALRDEALKLARRVHAPALVLHGARDTTVSPAGARKLARILPDAQVRIFPRTGHLMPLDVESDAVCTAVRDFFQGVVDGQVRPRD